MSSSSDGQDDAAFASRKDPFGGKRTNLDAILLDASTVPHSGYEGDDDSPSELCCSDEDDVDIRRGSQKLTRRSHRTSTTLVARQRIALQPRDDDVDARMVLEPKFADYGTIHSIGEVVPSPPSARQAGQTQQSNPAGPPTQAVNVRSPGNPHEPRQTVMTQGDLYQRQPLLPTPTKGDKWGHGSHPTDAAGYYMEDDDEDGAMQKTEDANGVISISMPPRFPQERWKTFVALMISFFSSILMLIVLALVHERVPDRKVYGPLPDVFYDVLAARDWGLSVSEYLMIIALHSNIIMMVLHKHRFILMRRFLLMISMLYLYRSLTMLVTVLPISSKTYYCSPQSNHTTPLELAKRVYQMSMGLGLSINGKQTFCGDFIFSGHTLTFVLCYLFISEYTPKKLYLLHWFYWLIGVVGVFMLEISRAHYTIDVVLAYYATTRIFWIYHTMANNAFLKQHSEKNLFCRLWWFRAFLFFEGNVGGQVPRQWPDWPFPWPRRFQTKSRDS